MPQIKTLDIFKNISKSQQNIVSDLLKKSGFDVLAVTDYIKQEFNGETVSDIPRTAYKSLVGRLKANEVKPSDITDPDDIPL